MPETWQIAIIQKCKKFHEVKTLKGSSKQQNGKVGILQNRSERHKKKDFFSQFLFDLLASSRFSLNMPIACYYYEGLHIQRYLNMEEEKGSKGLSFSQSREGGSLKLKQMLKNRQSEPKAPWLLNNSPKKLIKKIHFNIRNSCLFLKIFF